MWAVLLGCLTVVAAPEVMVQTLDGRQVVGSVKEWTSQRLELETAEGAVALEAKLLLSVEPKSAPLPPDNKPPISIELTDGSRLLAADYLVDQATAKFTVFGSPSSAPLKSLALVRFQEPTAEIAKQWEQILATKVAGDLIVVRKGESIDYLEGELRDISAEEVQFVSEGQSSLVKRNRLEGLVYSRAGRPELPDPICVIASADGSRLAVVELALKDDHLEAQTPAGLKASLPWNLVTGLDYSVGKVQYLGDAVTDAPGLLKPESLKVQTYADQQPDVLLQWRQPRANQWGVNRPLRLGKQTYGRGLAIRSRTELVYRLRGAYRRLTMIAGIDDAVGNAGNVRLLIRGDDRTLHDALLTGSDEPLPLDLDIQGVSRLTIIVDFGADDDTSDLLDLCEARVTK
jgi:hypothetical protein